MIFHYLIFLLSLEVQLVISRECHTLRLFDSFSSELEKTTSVWCMSVWYLRYGQLYHKTINGKIVQELIAHGSCKLVYLQIQFWLNRHYLPQSLLEYTFLWSCYDGNNKVNCAVTKREHCGQERFIELVDSPFCVVEDEVVCYKNAIIYLLLRLKTRLNNKGIHVTDLKQALHFLPLFVLCACINMYI